MAKLLLAVLLLLGRPVFAQTLNSNGMLVTDAELLDLPTSGSKWTLLYDMAHDEGFCLPSWPGSDTDFAFFDKSNDHDVCTLAKALVSRREYLADPNSTDASSLREEVVDRIADLAATDPNASGTDYLLAVKRNLAAYILAADTIRLAEVDPNVHNSLLAFIDADGSGSTSIITHVFPAASGRNNIRTLKDGALTDPTNWGGMARASALAAYMYQGAESEAATVLHAHLWWMGDTTVTYEGFSECTSAAGGWSLNNEWQGNGAVCEDDEYFGIAPSNATAGDQNCDIGSNPTEEASRGESSGGCTETVPDDCDFSECISDYVWQGLQGPVLTSWMAFHN
jgi:hypothetical protein